MVNGRNVSIVGLDPLSFDGVAVVIDVIRAFTTAAAAFAAGAATIRCVESLELARELRTAGVVLMGEERGSRPEGFDFGNSPLAFDGRRLDGASVVQRTTNGTRGLLWVEAPVVLAAAASNAAATARWITAHHPTADVVLVCTDTSTDEDRACADHLAGLLASGVVDVVSIRNRILAAGSAHETQWRRHRGDDELAEFRADVERCADVDRHAIAMVGRRNGSIVELRPESA